MDCFQIIEHFVSEKIVLTKSDDLILLLLLFLYILILVFYYPQRLTILHFQYLVAICIDYLRIGSDPLIILFIVFIFHKEWLVYIISNPELISISFDFFSHLHLNSAAVLASPMLLILLSQ